MPVPNRYQKTFISANMLKPFLSSLLLSAVFSVNLSASAQEVPKLRQGMTYSEARKLLIEGSWQAVFNPDQVNNSDRGVVIDGLIKKGYTEVVDCSGTGLGLCVFKFQNAKGQNLFVRTVNNSARYESKVFSWKLE